jgi:hypothetical protein
VTRLRAIEDLHTWLKARGGWVWGRSAELTHDARNHRMRTI